MQVFAVDSSEKSININLKATVDRYTNIDQAKGDSDLVSKNLFLNQYQVKEIFDKNAASHSTQWDISIYRNLKVTLIH